MEATDASRLVCVVVVSYQEYSLTHTVVVCEVLVSYHPICEHSAIGGIFFLNNKAVNRLSGAREPFLLKVTSKPVTAKENGGKREKREFRIAQTLSEKNRCAQRCSGDRKKCKPRPASV